MKANQALLSAAVEVERLELELQLAYKQLFAFAEDYKVMNLAMQNKRLEVEFLRERLSKQIELNNSTNSD
ncbi:MAG: hypothetical protein RL358_448 [Pseudomonadota bacterium]|jgi:hypothetical protein